MQWSLDPGVLVGILAAEGLYLRAVRVLARRGFRVRRSQLALWHTGMALWIAGLISPIHTIGDELLSFHMASHILIADLAAPLLLAGARNPVLMFLLPRGVLVPLARTRWLRSAFRFLRRPLVAVPVYVFVLYAWHLTGPFEAAVRHPLVHALQHGCFVGIGMLLWWPVLDPQRRRLRPELWKIGYFFGARMLTMLLGMGFVFTRHPLYEGVYGSGTRRYDLTPVDDQQIAGGIMVTVDIYLMVFVLCLVFWRAAQASARSEAAERALATGAT